MQYMRILPIVVFALGVVPALAEDLPVVPDQVSTPGVIGSTDKADICGKVDGLTYSQRHRDTTAAMKTAAYSIYNINKAGRDFEVDHRVPLCLGGADDQHNLWPQQGWQHPSFHDKDRLETRICSQVCRHGMDLAEAQALFMGDWIAAYQQVFGEPPQ